MQHFIIKMIRKNNLIRTFTYSSLLFLILKIYNNYNITINYVIDYYHILGMADIDINKANSFQNDDLIINNRKQTQESLYQIDHKTVFKISNKKSLLVYSLFLFTSIIMNLPSGITTTCLKAIKTEFNLGETESGAVVSLLLWGCVVGNVVFIFLIEKNYRKLLLIISYAICLGSLIVIGLVENRYIFYAMRFINGMGTAYISTFNPIWVDQFSPKNASSILMAFHNLSSIFGNILGAGLSTFLLNAFEWRTLFLLCGILHFFSMIPCILLKGKYFNRNMIRKDQEIFIIKGKAKKVDFSDDFNYARNESLNDNNDIEKVKYNNRLSLEENLISENILSLTDEYQGENALSLKESISLLIKNKTFLLLSSCFMIMMFVSSALLSWMQIFCIETFNVSKDYSSLTFTIIVVTSPVSGILLGGFIVQKLGGYQNIKALYLALINSSVLVGISIIIFFAVNRYFFSSLIWLYLFFGAMLDPCISGSIVRSLPQRIKGFGYNINLIYANSIGTCLAPIIFGAFYDLGKKIQEPLLSVSIVLSTPVLTCVFIIILIKMKKGTKNENEIVSEVEDISSSDKEEINITKQII